MSVRSLKRPAICALGFALVLPFDSALGAAFRTSVLQPTPPAPEIRLMASDGTEFRLSQRRGQIVVLSFGYTSCPDVCPTILAKLAQARARLRAPASKVQVVFVTVDPTRDTPDRLRAHMDRFDRTFVGVTGTREELARVQQAYGIVAQQGPPRDRPGAILVDHSAPVYVIDQDGRLRLMFTDATSVEDMAHDLQLLSEALEDPR
jgi:protein SCO1